MKKLFLSFLVLGLLLSGNAYAGWFDKDIIKVTKCWNPAEYKNYNEDNAESIRSGFTKWEWELNLKEKIAYHIIEDRGELKIDQFKIKISTKDYIIVHDPTGYWDDVQFDLNKKSYITSSSGRRIQKICNFN